MATSIADNLARVQERLRRAARKAGRDPAEITLIAVTKGVEVKRIREAVRAGLRVFGENYVQEAQEKIEKIRGKTIRWHLIGHLQKNKAKFAVELFDCIHTVDSLSLAKEINKRTPRPMDVLIQVNISGEKTKHGAGPSEAAGLAAEIAGLENLRLRGLMTIPPVFEDPERSRPYYITLRRLAEKINRLKIPGVLIHDLSMGMSADFDIAIEEGATMVRVGTAIFGPRATKASAGEKKGPKAKKGRKDAAFSQGVH